MNRHIPRALVGLALLGLAGCAGNLPPDPLSAANAPDVASFPPNAFGGGYQDPDTGALNQAAWAFASAANTRGNPGEAARAAASVDYMSGKLAVSPRYQEVSPLVKREMLDARAEVRRTLGIAPDAPSQAVVDGLLGVTRAAYVHDTQAALASLSTPIFTLGPQATLDKLAYMPFLSATNIATIRARQQGDGPTENRVCWSCG